jgi:hypothetical protein
MRKVNWTTLLVFLVLGLVVAGAATKNYHMITIALGGFGIYCLATPTRADNVPGFLLLVVAVVVELLMAISAG